MNGSPRALRSAPAEKPTSRFSCTARRTALIPGMSSTLASGKSNLINPHPDPVLKVREVRPSPRWRREREILS